MESIMSKQLINLKDAINEMIYNSSDDKLKSFYNSSTGRMIFDVLELSHSSFNYSASMLADELMLTTAKTEENVIKLANELSYHIKHRVPAKVSCRVRINDVNDSRWNNISSVELVSGEFSTTIGDYNFAQVSNFKFGKNNLSSFQMCQAYKKQYLFNIPSMTSWARVAIPDSIKISNYLNTGLQLDAKLFKLENNGSETEYTVIRSVPTEADLANGNFVLSQVNSDKQLELLFGNGSFGDKGFGTYRLEYYETTGAAANHSSPINTKAAYNNIGINVYDLYGKIIPNAMFITDMFEIYTSSNVENGEDMDTIEDIRYKAMRSAALNNTLLNSNDFTYYVKDRYGIGDAYFWGDNVENNIRKFDNKDVFNTTFFTSKFNKYDFDLAENIRYDILSNTVEVSKSSRDYNPNSFDIVPDCDRYAHKKMDDCLSFRTLYILGRIKPIAYYYSLLKDENSLITNIIESVSSKSVDFNMAYIEADVININAYVTLKGTDIRTDSEIKELMLNEYNNKNTDKMNIDGSFRNALVETNYTVSKIQLNPTFGLSRFNTDLNSIMMLNSVSDFDRYTIVKIIDELKLNLGNYSKVSECLRSISRFIDTLYPYIQNASKEAVKSILTLCVNKYNETKSNAINSGNLEGLDIPLIQFNITDITFAKG